MLYPEQHIKDILQARLAVTAAVGVQTSAVFHHIADQLTGVIQVELPVPVAILWNFVAGEILPKLGHQLCFRALRGA